MQLIPVLDLMGGQVVRAARGQRECYRRLSGSCLSSSSDPAAVATAFRERLGLDSVYVADLDAIAGAAPARAAYDAVAGTGMRMWIDAGVRSAADAERVREAGADVVIAGLETLTSPAELASMIETLGADAVCFSLDLREGAPVTTSSRWSGMDSHEIALAAADARAEQMLVLDLARIGTNGGTATLALCRAFHARRPEVALIAGGGICSIADLRSLRRAGVVGALVATALHDGRIRRDDVRRLTAGELR